MKKFKLIKLYPSLPTFAKLEDIVIRQDNGTYVHKVDFPYLPYIATSKEIEGWPDYWKDISEQVWFGVVRGSCDLVHTTLRVGEQLNHSSIEWFEKELDRAEFIKRNKKVISECQAIDFGRFCQSNPETSVKRLFKDWTNAHPSAR